MGVTIAPLATLLHADADKDTKMVDVFIASNFTQHNNERDLINRKLLHIDDFLIFGGSANSNQCSVLLNIFKNIVRSQLYCIFSRY